MPGSLIYTGNTILDNVTIEVIRFDGEEYVEESITQEQLKDVKPGSDVLWVNIIGLHDVGLIQEIGELFNIHNLALEDVLNTTHRPIFDDYDDNFLVISKMLRMEDTNLVSEQFSVVTGKNFLITFQEKPGDVFEGVRNRLRNKKGRIRQRGSDYLTFALLDVIVDHYVIIVEVYGEEINDQEVKLLEDVGPETLGDINLSKKEITFLRKYVRPLKEAIVAFHRSESHLIEKKTKPFLSDLLNHITNVAENIELYRETIQDNLAAHHSHMSNKLNDILKVLTIFSVIFIPLTFMAGIYGMNFEYLPELKFKYAYPIFWGALITVAVSMLLYFKRKKWL